MTHMLAESLSDASTITIGLGVLIATGIVYMSVMLTSMKRDIHELKKNSMNALTREAFGNWTVRLSASNRRLRVPNPHNLDEHHEFATAQGDDDAA